MKPRAIILVIFIAAVAGGGCLLTQAFADADDAKPAPKAEAPEGPTNSRDTNGNAVVKISGEIQKQIELKIETLPAAQMAPELKAYGRVVDPGPLAALLTELASAQAAAVASSNELARLKSLSGSGNASARALETAGAAALRDQLQMQSADERLRLSWGREIAGHRDMAAFIQSLINQDILLLRVDLPAGPRLAEIPSNARVTGISGNSAEAQVLGQAVSVEPLMQGQGFWLELKTNTASFLFGEAITAQLKVPGEPLSGVTIPRDAVIRTEGKGWVYVAAGSGSFTRKEIPLEQPADGGWFVTNGVAAGDQVVTRGVQALFSEEQKASFGLPD